MSGRPSNSIARSFLIGITVALVAAWLAPDLGKTGGTLASGTVSKIGIIAIFFFQGVGLPTERFGQSLGQWRLHLFVQGFCFLLIPLVTWGLLTLFAGAMPSDLVLGFLFLAVLPTTISSAAVMVGLAGGDLPSAVFNTAFSNLLGVLTVPIAANWILSTGTAMEIPVAPLLGKVALLLAVPLILGQLARRWLKDWAAQQKSRLTFFSNLVIFFLVYTAFCDAFTSKSSNAAPAGETVAWAIGGSVVLLACVTGLAWILAWRFPHPQRIAAFYCSSQKTLAAGLPLAGAIYAVGDISSLPPLSTFALPLLCFHPLQLILGGVLAGRFAPTNTAHSQTL